MLDTLVCNRWLLITVALVAGWNTMAWPPYLGTFPMIEAAEVGIAAPAQKLATTGAATLVLTFLLGRQLFDGTASPAGSGRAGLIVAVAIWPEGTSTEGKLLDSGKLALAVGANVSCGRD